MIADINDYLLQIKNLTVSYGSGGDAILSDLNFSLKKQELVTITGVNGVGKTTLLRAIAGTLPYYLGHIKAGEIIFDSCNIQKLPVFARTQRGLAYVSEEKNLFKNLTVADNLKIAELGVSRAKEEDYEEVFRYFPQIAKLKNRTLNLCSGGEQQMVAIGRALLTKPKVLLLDEPSLGLAPKLIQHIFTNLVKLKQYCAMVIVEQSQVNLSYLNAVNYVLDDHGRLQREK